MAGTALKGAALAGYSLILLCYAIKLPVLVRDSWLNGVGFLLLAIGYSLLITHTVMHEKKEPSDDSVRKRVRLAAYLILATFFIFGFVVPWTPTVHGYDALAAIGYACLVASSIQFTTGHNKNSPILLPMLLVGATCITLYYLGSALHYASVLGTFVGGEAYLFWPHVGTLIGRLVIAVVYSTKLYGVIVDPQHGTKALAGFCPEP